MGSPENEAEGKAPVTMLKGFSISDTPEALHIRWRNRDYYGTLGAIIIYVVLAGFAPVVLMLFVTSGILSGMAAAAIWLYILYAALASQINGTSITFDALELRIKKGPFPWTRIQTFGVDEIERFETQRKRAKVGSEKLRHYMVVRLKNGRTVDVVEQLLTGKEAEHLQRIFTKRLA